jgi:hypothetical protein
MPELEQEVAPILPPAVAERPPQRGNPNIRQHAQEGGRRSGRRRRRLLLEDVEQVLGGLDTLEDAMRWLRQIALWAAGGMLHGAVASACNRSVEVWVRAHESRLTREVVEQLRGRLDDLEGQAARARAGRP